MQGLVKVSSVRVGGGWMTLAYTDGPAVVSDSTVSGSRAESEEMVTRDLKGRGIEPSPAPATGELQDLASRILGGDISVPISRHGISDFRWSVFEFVRRIPKGKVASYSDVAKGIGKPNSQRAVGTVMATHCLTYIIPCHRVVKSDLSPGRFSSPQSKAEMLKAEGIVIEDGRIRETHRLAPRK